MILPETVIQDLRYGVRMLFRNAGFTAVSVLALALGIGVNTGTFTAYKALVGRSLDARDPSRMVNLALILQSGPIPSCSAIRTMKLPGMSAIPAVASSHGPTIN